MRILVCIKPVPDSEHYHKIRIDSETKTLIRDGVPMKMNEEDRYALETALRLREQLGDESTVEVLSMAPPASRETLLLSLAMGADKVYLLCDMKFAGSDTYATSYALAKAIEHIGMPDVILAGDSTEDSGTCHVPAQLGEWLAVPHIQRVSDVTLESGLLQVKKTIENHTLTYQLPMPNVVAVTRDLPKPRIPTMRGVIQAKNKPFITFTADDVGCDEKLLGLVGSPTSAGELFELDTKRKAEILSGSSEVIVEQILGVIRRTVGLQKIIVGER